MCQKGAQNLRVEKSGHVGNGILGDPGLAAELLTVKKSQGTDCNDGDEVVKP